ncbi:FKBP-type peptidyl-prolyl cis-trans isomerase [uncultured Mobiluncus sp.]|uniref:FKBP-type peptidyl-prolyl cis-trans isomerase n=1 Tax=uncultured Mobiluncus sp. TaxID=293425 RepID=UPI00260F836D|nr:FKBP-type peptidyl-prolyl cis-trans isomerase [uncultured Mobiluncus sp.]
MQHLQKRLAVLSLFALAAAGLTACQETPREDNAPLANPKNCVKTITPATSAEPAAVKPVENGPVPAVNPPDGFGTEPNIAAGTGPAPKDFIRTVLHEGTGTVVSANADVIVHYKGQTWNGEVFDNSWQKGEPAHFSLGSNIIEGWTWGLAGRNVGDRIELVIPPRLAYKELTEREQAAKDAGQPLPGKVHPLAGETLVFVIDILFAPPVAEETQLAAYTQLLAQSQPTGAKLPDGLRIYCSPGSEPQPAYVEGSKVPGKPFNVWTLEGQGQPIQAGDQVGYVVVSGSWGDKPTSTWINGQGVLWADAETMKAVGKNVGSRLVMVGPPNKSAPRGVVQIVDIVDAIALPTLE